MYTQEQTMALEKFEGLAARLGSQNKACAQVGISAAIMSPLKKGTYTGDIEAQFAKLISYFKVKEEAASQPSANVNTAAIDYVPTSISSKVYDVIRNCQLKGGLAIACGDAGIGKTMAAKKFLRDNPNDAIYVALNPCLTTVKSLLKVLCGKLNISERTVDEMWLGLAAKLRDGMVIIVDEAQHLPIKTLEALRALTDYFYEQGQTLGIVFVGNTETVNNFGGRKKAEFAQISNRTRQKKIYTTANIRREDMQLLFPELRQNDPEIDFLLNIARSAQAIRGAVNLYSNALDNDNTSYEGLVAMAKHMEMRV
ncbi:MAG: AAA family ATPase [Clostridia bacterium]|nr:AAA family ATPase [Clostridia bacterium]